jgi:hypothetical protein
MRIWILILCSLRLAAPVFAQEAVHEESRTRFRAVDIYLDSKGAPLAAWQIEFAATNGMVKIVGIEGGEGVFAEAPFYDPKAIQNERAIIAAFSTESVGKLPTGRTRVATIHLQVMGTAEPQFELKVQTVGDAEGKRMGVEASFEMKARMDAK